VRHRVRVVAYVTRGDDLLHESQSVFLGALSNAATAAAKRTRFRGSRDADPL
jgi:hypothetical protein